MLLMLKIILFPILFLLCIVACILFIPLQISAKGTNRTGDLEFRSKVYWLTWLFAVKILFKDKKLSLYIQIFGIPIKIPLKKKEKKSVSDKMTLEESQLKSAETEKAEEKPEKKTEKTKTGKERKKTFGITDVRSVYDTYKPFVTSVVFPQLKYVAHSFTLRVKKLDLTIAADDPSFVGMTQGAVTALSPFMKSVKFLNPVSIRFDYVRNTTEFYADLYFSMKLYGIVIRLLIIWWHYRKISRANIRISHESDVG